MLAGLLLVVEGFVVTLHVVAVGVRNSQVGGGIWHFPEPFRSLNVAALEREFLRRVRPD